jgi:hypothetical protein
MEIHPCARRKEEAQFLLYQNMLINSLSAEIVNPFKSHPEPNAIIQVVTLINFSKCSSICWNMNLSNTDATSR